LKERRNVVCIGAGTIRYSLYREGTSNMPDIEIDHEEGNTKVTGLPVEKIKKFKDDLEGVSGWPVPKPKGDADIKFRRVKAVKILRPDGSPDQHIWPKDTQD
jgi:hypothetical protein